MNNRYILSVGVVQTALFLYSHGKIAIHGEFVDYISLDSIPYFSDCGPLIAGLGYVLVELRVIPQHDSIRVIVVISKPVKGNDSIAIGVNDCAKVHRVLLPRLEALLNSQDIYMEVTSPGMERLIKNSAEFSLFKGRFIRVWDKEITDWIFGKICDSDTQSLTLEVIHRDDSLKDGKTEPEIKIIPFVRISKAKLLQIGG